MTTNQPDKLSQIENFLQSFITNNQLERQVERQASNERLTRIEQLVDSNSRSIQALADRISELSNNIDEATEERAELRRATIGITNLLSSLDSDNS